MFWASGIGGWPSIFIWINPPSLGSNGIHCIESHIISWTVCWVDLQVRHLLKWRGCFSLASREGCNCCLDDLFLYEHLECVALHCRGTRIHEETMALSFSCVWRAETPYPESVEVSVILCSLSDAIVKRNNFLMWELIFLPCETLLGATVFDIR